MKSNYLAQGWLVLVLALVFGGALAAVQLTLGPRIEANLEQAAQRAIPALVPGATRGVSEEIGGRMVYRALDAEGNFVGWVVPASGAGYADQIQVLIGYTPTADRILGLHVLTEKETPGLGSNIRQEGFITQFQVEQGLPVEEPLVVVRRQPRQVQEIQAVTGATISSDVVVAITNRTTLEVRRDLEARAAELNAATGEGE